MKALVRTGMSFPSWSVCLLLLVSLFWLGSAQAQLGVAMGIPGTSPSEETTNTAEAITSVPDALRSPRATMETFLGAMNDIKRGEPERIGAALRALDLSAINSLVRVERGTDLAWLLLQVIDRTRKVELDSIPDAETGAAWVFARYKNGAIRISRQTSGRWQFDALSLEALPAISDELASMARVDGLSTAEYLPWHLRLRQDLPSALKQQDFLLENWQWIGLLIIVAVGVLMDWALSWVLRLFVRGWRRRNEHEAFADIDDGMLRPFGLMVMALVWWSGVTLMRLPESALLVLLVAVKFLASVAGVWAAYRLVDLIAAWLRYRSELTENKIDDVLAPLIPRTLKVFVTVIGIVFVADNLDIDVTGLLAGLGLGGLAFALAAKDMVQNLFGSVTVLLDRTFTVGDWIIVGDQEGTVERIGFRSTRLRTFYNSVVTIPNARFISADVDNMGDRQYRRMKTTYGLTYDTPPDKIEAFCEGVRELVRQHPYMRKDYFHVYFNSFGASSLDILIYVFWETPDWTTELQERHRFLLDSLRLAKQIGVEFAYPTQTLYLERSGTDSSVGEQHSYAEAVLAGQLAARDIVSRQQEKIESK